MATSEQSTRAEPEQRGRGAPLLRTLMVAAVVAVVAAGLAIATFLRPPGAPPVQGYLDGQQIEFIHTEASDPKVAELLTNMKGKQVVAVPQLAQAPQALLADVYVFQNGARGGGPLGFQPDVFDNPPGSNGYTPLRRLNLVGWKNESAARELKSAPEVKAAEAGGELTIERPGVVINMPLLSWPGGQR